MRLKIGDKNVDLLVMPNVVPPRKPEFLAIRVFKSERQMELWTGESLSGPMRLLKTFPIAAMSGTLGPKRREGDLQVPEGFYYINRFNPYSHYHLSLGINYPNRSDLRLGDSNPGNDIYIHGNHVSAGCMAMTDPGIDAIFGYAVRAREAGESRIPVSIFPCKMNSENWDSLCRQFATNKGLIHFWSTLKPAYDQFETNRRWPSPHLGSDGYYAWPKARR